MNRRGSFSIAFAASVGMHAMLVGAALYTSHSSTAPRVRGMRESQASNGSLEMLDDSDKGPVYQTVDLAPLPPAVEFAAPAAKQNTHSNAPTASVLDSTNDAQLSSFSPFDKTKVQAIGINTDDSTALPKVKLPPLHFAAKPMEKATPTTVPDRVALGPSVPGTRVGPAAGATAGGTGGDPSSNSAQHIFAGPRVAKAGGRGAHGKGTSNGYDSRGIPIPDYPAESRRRGEQGLVVLEAEILPDGTTGNITLVTDPGCPRLIDSAIAALRDATFEPATMDGAPVKGRIKVPFRFVLTQ